MLRKITQHDGENVGNTQLEFDIGSKITERSKAANQAQKKINITDALIDQCDDMDRVISVRLYNGSHFLKVLLLAKQQSKHKDFHLLCSINHYSPEAENSQKVFFFFEKQ